MKSLEEGRPGSWIEGEGEALIDSRRVPKALQKQKIHKMKWMN
jgi:hypothetical protein